MTCFKAIKRFSKVWITVQGLIFHTQRPELKSIQGPPDLPNIDCVAGTNAATQLKALHTLPVKQCCSSHKTFQRSGGDSHILKKHSLQESVTQTSYSVNGKSQCVQGPGVLKYSAKASSLAQWQLLIIHLLTFLMIIAGRQGSGK